MLGGGDWLLEAGGGPTARPGPLQGALAAADGRTQRAKNILIGLAEEYI
jgi:hypothetical protein